MSQATTQPYRRSVSGSIGAGMKSVFGGGGRTYYMLVHKVSSKYHKAGESQPIIVDEIEIGRGSQCQVRFDDSFTTVSRRHAAIVKDGDRWKLVQLSTTNSTYLNGQKVHNEWYLQNGDEIQLSTNGPKLGFIIPEGDKGKVSSIGLTARLNLFRKQALRPYKTALSILGCALVLAIVGIVWLKISTDKDIKALMAENDAKKEELVRMNDSVIQIGANQDSLKTQLEQMKLDKEAQDKAIKKLQKNMVVKPSTPGSSANNPNNDELSQYEPYVFYIVTSFVDVFWHQGGTTTFNSNGLNAFGWRGTGFLLEDGTFVTARHVTEPWYYWSNEEGQETMLGLATEVAMNGKVVAHFVATSSSGESFTFSSEDLICKRGNDETTLIVKDDVPIFVPKAPFDGNDWAYMKTPYKNGLKYDAEKSKELVRNTSLTILGFPFGFGVKETDDISPLVTSAMVSANGLQNGKILVTNTGVEHGNSGGPVFYRNSSGGLEVVGLVSAVTGRSTGFFVPISNFKKH